MHRRSTSGQAGLGSDGALNKYFGSSIGVKRLRETYAGPCPGMLAYEALGRREAGRIRLPWTRDRYLETSSGSKRRAVSAPFRPISRWPGAQPKQAAIRT